MPTMSDPRTFALPAEPGRESEDAIALGRGVAVVVDGAGLPASMRAGCRHSVVWYARVLAEAFRDRLEDRRKVMAEALAGAIAAVAALHSDTCDLAAGSPSATVAAWRVEGDALEHLVLSDASIVLLTADGETREITDLRIDDAVDRGAAEALGGRVVDPAEEARVRFAALDRMRNVPGGFWCCHFDPAAAAEARTGRVPLAELTGIVASSDGGTRGFRSFGAHSLGRFGDLARKGDLARIVEEIRAAERAAPARPRVKRHDDIALVLGLIPGER